MLTTYRFIPIRLCAKIVSGREHMPQKLSPQIITAAIAGFEQQKLQLDGQIAELRAMLTNGSRPTAVTSEATTPEPATKRRKFSAAARRKMALAQKARWAKVKGEAEPAAPSQTPAEKPKRKLSAAARATLAANLKKARAAKAAKANAASAPAPRPKRRFSPEGLKKIIAANKKMWARRRAAAKAKSAATKKAPPARKKAVAKKTAATPAAAPATT